MPTEKRQINESHAPPCQPAPGRWLPLQPRPGVGAGRGQSAEGLSTQPPAGLAAGLGCPSPQPPVLCSVLSGTLQPRPGHCWPLPPGRGPWNPKFTAVSVCVFVPGRGSHRRQRRRRSREQPRAGGRRSLVIRWLLLDFPSESLLQREQQEAGPPGGHTETDVEPSQGPLLSQSRWGPGSSTPRPVAPERTLTRRRERLWPSGGAQPPEPRCPRLCSRNGGVNPACRRRRGQSGDWGQPQPGPRSVGASQSGGGSFWGTPSSVHR